MVTAPSKENECPVSGRSRGHENTEWSISYAFHMADGMASLPRVLLVGDSICNAYQVEVRRLLDGVANVSYWVSSYCVTSPGYTERLAMALGEAKYAAIHFNNGLHSLDTPTEPWSRALEEAFLLMRERQPEAKIIWASSTPLADSGKTAKCRELNDAAGKVVRRLGGIAENDLFAMLDPLPREANWTDCYHHSAKTVLLEAEQVAKAIMAAAGIRPAPANAIWPMRTLPVP